MQDKILHFMKENNLCLLNFPDQNILNCLVPKENLMELSPLWNFTPFSSFSCDLKKYGMPKLIHYTCYKPWQYPRRLIKWIPGDVCKWLRFYHRYAASSLFSVEIERDSSFFATCKMLWKIVFQPVEIKFRAIKNNLLHLLHK